MDARGERLESRIGGPEPEAWKCTDFLAHARFILAFVCAVIVYLNAASLGSHVRSGLLLILVYLTYSLFNLITVRLDWHRSFASELCLHASEVVIISLIAMFTGGNQSPFLGLYLIVLLSAACEWGFSGSLITSCACIMVLFSDSLLPPAWSGIAGQSPGGHSSFVTAITMSANLFSFAFLLGLLVEKERNRYVDAQVIARLVRGIAPGPTFSATISNTLTSVREHFDADQVRLTIQEIRGEQADAWEVTRQAGDDVDEVRSWKLAQSVRQDSFAAPPEDVRRLLELSPAGADPKLREALPQAGRGESLAP